MGRGEDEEGQREEGKSNKGEQEGRAEEKHGTGQVCREGGRKTMLKGEDGEDRGGQVCRETRGKILYMYVGRGRQVFRGGGG